MSRYTWAESKPQGHRPAVIIMHVMGSAEQKRESNKPNDKEYKQDAIVIVAAVHWDSLKLKN